MSVEALQDQLKEKQEKYNKLLNEFNSYKESAKEYDEMLEEDIKDKEAHIAKLEQTLQLKERLLIEAKKQGGGGGGSGIEKMTEENTQLRVEIDNLMKQIAELKEDNECQKMLADQEMEEMNEKLKEYKRLEPEYEKTKEILQTVQRELQNLNDIYENQKIQIQHLETQLKASEQQPQQSQPNHKSNDDETDYLVQKIKDWEEMYEKLKLTTNQQIQQLDEQVRDKNDEAHKLKDKMKKLEQEQRNLNEENAKLKEVINQFQTTKNGGNANNEEELENLRLENDRLNRKIKLMNDQQDDINKLRAKLYEREDEIKKLKEDYDEDYIEELRQQINSLQTHLEDEKQKTNELNQKVVDLQLDLFSVESVREENAELKNILSEKIEQISELYDIASQVKLAESEVNNLRAQHVQEKKRYEDKILELELQINETSIVYEEVKMLKDNIKTLTERNKNLNDELDQFKQNYTNKLQLSQDAEQNIRETELKLKIYEDQLAQQKSTLSHQKEEIEKLHDENVQLKTKQIEFNRLEQNNTSVKEIQTMMIESQNENKRLKDQIARDTHIFQQQQTQSKQQMKDLEDQVQDLTEKNRMMELDIKGMREESTRLKTELDKNNEELTKARAKIQELIQMEQKFFALKDLEATVQELTSENQSLKEQLESNKLLVQSNVAFTQMVRRASSIQASPLISRSNSPQQSPPQKPKDEQGAQLQLDSLLLTEQQLKQDNEALKKKLAEQDEQLENLEEENDDLKEKLTNLQQQVDQMTQQLNEKSTEQELKGNGINEKQAEIDQLTAKLQISEDQIQYLMKQLSDVQSELQTRENTQKESDREVVDKLEVERQNEITVIKKHYQMVVQEKDIKIFDYRQKIEQQADQIQTLMEQLENKAPTEQPTSYQVYEYSLVDTVQQENIELKQMNRGLEQQLKQTREELAREKKNQKKQQQPVETGRQIATSLHATTSNSGTKVLTSPSPKKLFGQKPQSLHSVGSDGRVQVFLFLKQFNNLKSAFIELQNQFQVKVARKGKLEKSNAVAKPQTDVYTFESVFQNIQELQEFIVKGMAFPEAKHLLSVQTMIPQANIEVGNLLVICGFSKTWKKLIFCLSIETISEMVQNVFQGVIEGKLQSVQISMNYREMKIIRGKTQALQNFLLNLSSHQKDPLVVIQNNAQEALLFLQNLKLHIYNQSKIKVSTPKVANPKIRILELLIKMDKQFYSLTSLTSSIVPLNVKSRETDELISEICNFQTFKYSQIQLILTAWPLSQYFKQCDQTLALSRNPIKTLFTNEDDTNMSPSRCQQCKNPSPPRQFFGRVAGPKLHSVKRTDLLEKSDRRFY